MSLSETFKTCLGIKEKETVLLVTDSAMTEVSNIIRGALSPIADEFIFLSIAPRSVHGEELPKVVSEAMMASDVVVGATSKSMTHTQATKDSVKKGTRVASMPGITVEMLTRGGMTADYKEVSLSAKKVARVLSDGERIEIKTEAGTGFETALTGRDGHADTGLLVNKGDFGNLPGGEGFIAPLEKESTGRIVFDGPIASSGLDHKPIIVDVEDGKATYTNYGELERIFKDIYGARYVGEIGIGVNPKAQLIGNILEDEKALGTAHVAFGNNLNFGGRVDAKAHMDGIIKNPTIVVDGKVIIRNGAQRI
jgi:leucyl aminopeptidase (aminopeptidase T)